MMVGQDVVVAVFGSLAEAERARDRLIEIGIPAADIRMGSGEAAERAGIAETEAFATPRRQGFWDWLFGRDVPEYDRPWYEANLREGRSVVSVLVHDGEERHRVAEILENFDPIDFEESESRYRGTETSAVAGGERTSAGDTVIPVVKEDVAVGKRVHERRYRIRTYTVETPVEQDVRLRDERVVIERRPVSDPAAAARAGSNTPKDREYEVVERHEEPSVEKRRSAEEVIVHKEADERTERVRDTVRETKVDIDRDAAAANDPGPTLPREHKP